VDRVTALEAHGRVSPKDAVPEGGAGGRNERVLGKLKPTRTSSFGQG
jgi:hypothetical protein